jgi:hypothetical protein
MLQNVAGSFDKIERQDFPNFKKLQFVKKTTFSEFYQTFNFYSKDFQIKNWLP